MDHRQRIQNADYTSQLIAALKMLEKTDFSKMMGSGVLVQLTPITPERHLADEFMVAAEDISQVAPLLAQSIRASLQRRKVMLRSEIADIDKAIG